MRVRVDDATIDVAIEGNGNPLVLIHGFPFARDMWDRQASELANSHLVIRPDMRGAGRSTSPDGPYLMETLAADIAAILDELRLERVAIAGHSMGGYVAMAFARMFTERVSKLALVCSKLAADSESAARDRETLASAAERENSIEPIVNAYISRLFAPARVQERSPIVDQARALARKNSVTGAAGLLRGMALRADAYDIAGELDFPVLVLAGAADQVVPPAEAGQVGQAFPRGELTVIPGAGHAAPMEEPEAVTAALRDFLE